MIQAKIYAPTLEDHRQAVRLTKRSRATSLLEKTAIVAVCMLIVMAWESNFAFPIAVDWSDLIVPFLIALGIDFYVFFDAQSEAKNRFETDESDNEQLGPRHYRATSKGVEWWWSTHHDLDEWAAYDRYTVTDKQLIVAQSKTGIYWILPRQDLSPQLLETVIGTLRRSGAKEVANRMRAARIDLSP